MQIIARPEILEEDYIPPSLPCREVQKRELAFCLSPLQRGLKPIDCLCHGKPGTGKTVLVKYVLKQLEENTNALSFYVNCWENKTLTQILDQLLRQVEMPIADSKLSVKLSALKRKINRKPCVIALDEVDKLRRRELNDILYNLKNLGRIGLICISNTRRYFLTLDPRITSRLSFKSIHFPSYSNEELYIILKQRIECRALYPNTWSRKTLELIADLAAGDARIAIQTLRNAAYIAEQRNRPKITAEDVDSTYKEVREIKRKYTIEKLGEHYKLVYKIIEENPRITSGKLFEAYRKACRQRGLKPRSQRTISGYLNELIALKYVRSERASVRGNVRSFIVNYNT